MRPFCRSQAGRGRKRFRLLSLLKRRSQETAVNNTSAAGLTFSRLIWQRRGGGADERLFLWCLSVPELLGGKQLSATVTKLSPWVEYEFRVLATNSIGTGEPSKPSKKTRTKEMRTYRKVLTFSQRQSQQMFAKTDFFFSCMQALFREIQVHLSDFTLCQWNLQDAQLVNELQRTAETDSIFLAIKQLCLG